APVDRVHRDVRRRETVGREERDLGFGRDPRVGDPPVSEAWGDRKESEQRDEPARSAYHVTRAPNHTSAERRAPARRDSRACSRTINAASPSQTTTRQVLKANNARS